MQRVTDQVNAFYLQQPAPRPLPYVVILNLLGDYTFEHPAELVDPVLIVGLVVLLAGMLFNLPFALLLVPLAIIVGRIALGIYRITRRTWDDIALLRKGIIVQAHILKLRAHRTFEGKVDGALLDCAIPVAPRRTYIGSVWVANDDEARQLSERGRVGVICLPRSPGTWRVVEKINSEARYDHLGSVAKLPEA